MPSTAVTISRAPRSSSRLNFFSAGLPGSRSGRPGPPPAGWCRSTGCWRNRPAGRGPAGGGWTAIGPRRTGRGLALASRGVERHAARRSRRTSTSTSDPARAAAMFRNRSSWSPDRVAVDGRHQVPAREPGPGGRHPGGGVLDQDPAAVAPLSSGLTVTPRNPYSISSPLPEHVDHLPGVGVGRDGVPAGRLAARRWRPGPWSARPARRPGSARPRRSSPRFDPGVRLEQGAVLGQRLDPLGLARAGRGPAAAGWTPSPRRRSGCRPGSRPRTGWPGSRPSPPCGPCRRPRSGSAFRSAGGWSIFRTARSARGSAARMSA